LLSGNVAGQLQAQQCALTLVLAATDRAWQSCAPVLIIGVVDGILASCRE
jgi:hypothetical protein